MMLWKDDAFLSGWFSAQGGQLLNFRDVIPKGLKFDEKSLWDYFSTKQLRPLMLLADVQYHIAKTGYIKPNPFPGDSMHILLWTAQMTYRNIHEIIAIIKYHRGMPISVGEVTISLIPNMLTHRLIDQGATGASLLTLLQLGSVLQRTMSRPQTDHSRWICPSRLKNNMCWAHQIWVSSFWYIYTKFSNAMHKGRRMCLNKNISRPY